MAPRIFIGTAGWGIPRAVAKAFEPDGSSLQRYASRFLVVEINSTFSRLHRPQTFARWAATAGDAFRFALKMPKAITHEYRLQGASELLREFLEVTKFLGNKCGPFLIQLPPSLNFDRAVAASFFELLRSLTAQPVVCEPRHASWFEPDAEKELSAFDISRVAADPGRVTQAGQPGGARLLEYYRLHGAPKIYRSAYDSAYLAALKETLLQSSASEVWCIFDNTASGAAAANALSLQELCQSSSR